MKKIVVGLSILLLITSNCTAQKSDIGNWFIYFGNKQIDKKWNWWHEAQYRNYNFVGDMEQLVLRTGLGYNLTENNNNLLLGYAFIRSNPYIAGTDTKTETSENRIYQQFITRQQFGKVFLQHRYRLEERFLTNNFRVRFRYFLSLNIPFNKRTLEKDAWYLSAYNELFLHLNSPVFDRDRIYGALGYVFNKNMRLETGLMYQVLENGNRPQFQIAFFNTIPFKK
jgi:hypothetical protein